jgi:transcription elongation factor GreB
LSDTQPITPAGFATMRARYEELFTVERPRTVEIVSWAAGNGDRSENGDYIYGRQRLRQIDRELTHLARRMKAVTVVDPAQPSDPTRAWFGARVTIVDDDDAERIVTLTGEDEADAGANRISWRSPLAQALRGARVGDHRIVVLPSGEKGYEVLAIAYP